MDDLDGILSSEQMIDPTSGFTGRVMEAIRREVEAPPALTFPWLRAGIGGGAMLFLLVGVIVALPYLPQAAWLSAAASALEVGGRILNELGAPVIFALLISLVSTHFALRDAG